MVSLGCAKNLVDAEIMLGALAGDGLDITSDPATADAIIVNTCSFIDAAQEESVDAILEQAALRDASLRNQAIVVSGCLSQRYRDELRDLLPEVDAFMGVDQVREAPAIVREAVRRRREQPDRPPPRRTRTGIRSAAGAGGPASAGPAVTVSRRPSYIPDYTTPRFRLTPPHYAYLKIAEGCNHPCSFCIIPRMRGSHRSRPEDDVVEEARRLLDEGVRELNLISQDTTYYGLDLGVRPAGTGNPSSPARFAAASGARPADAPNLARLLRRLNRLPGEFWIRVLYTHPAHWTDELIGTFAACDKVVRYVDLPLQHIDEVMLQRMRRETSRAHVETLIGRLREQIPGLALRTTFIVGFPGETEGQFAGLVDFIRAARFERLGVFPYSREVGTVAGRMQAQVSDQEKARRLEAAMLAQREVARSITDASVGRSVRVLVEGPATPADWLRSGLSPGGGKGAEAGSRVVARQPADAPDIDGRVFLRGPLEAGRFVDVRLVRSADYDLEGEVVA
ncbi:MAG: 30S ribosomal protein S12 methylthiotransferase RimO [Verrucomicrobiales bacterium]|nr:30S ribosomal protein S12 methylthiotransferase RimO [Verrucomicrobiales bacterium]MCP5528540.1 30S ribosomal protein S12 methylthiotransferase RimO [Verrucomicrobiales bacterium]